MVRTDAGVVAGYVQATVGADGVAEIAYVLGRPFWRRGHGFSACRAMLAELAETYGVTRVTATLDPRNAASLALLKKLGLEFVAEDAAAQEITYGRDLR